MPIEKTIKLHSIVKPVLEWARSKPALGLLVQSLFGSLFLAASAQMAIELPFTPVPISMQTLGVFLLVCIQRKAAVASIAMYLAQASMGLPVLAAGKINPLWMVGPTGGYLVGFMLSVYPAARLYGDKPSWQRALLSSFVCQMTILVCGTLWLACLLGPTKAFEVGFVPFLAVNLIKIVMGLGLVFPVERIRRGFSSFLNSSL